MRQVAAELVAAGDISGAGLLLVDVDRVVAARTRLAASSRLVTSGGAIA